MCLNFSTTIMTWYKRLFCETNSDVMYSSTVNEDNDVNFHYRKYDETTSSCMHQPVSETFNTEAYWRTFDDTYSGVVPQKTESQMTV